MINFAFISYSLGAGAYLLLAAILLLSIHKQKIEGILLLVAALMSVMWFVTVSYDIWYQQHLTGYARIFEILRDLAWFSFFLTLLGYKLFRRKKSDKKLPVLIIAVYAIGILLIVMTLFLSFYKGQVPSFLASKEVIILSFVLMSITGLVLVEQLYRNTSPEDRWHIKFLCIGVGGMFAYDFYMYADALLFKRMDNDLLASLGIINAMVVPLIALSASRNKEWSVKIFVSKQIVFHSAALLGSGFYLMLMAIAGYYIRDYGGTWGIALQSIFLFGAIGLLFILMFSGQVRARLKFFLNKHFFHYKYDYREEWLRFITTLSSASNAKETRLAVIKGISEIVESTGGQLWVKTEPGYFTPVASHSYPEKNAIREPVNGSLANFLKKREWVVDVTALYNEPELYSGLKLPQWLEDSEHAWLVVPMLHQDDLLGFIVLAHSRVSFTFNWEDIDLMKTVGRQAASYLALINATEALVDAQQFDAFNRLSAYVVHDLKNMVAQLSLVVSNAKKHIENPEFVEDAIHTVDNTVGRMNRLLEQLRKGKHAGNKVDDVDLCKLIERVILNRQAQKPEPRFICDKDALFVETDGDRLASVIEHLVQNAQDATSADGRVEVKLKRDTSFAAIEIKDEGTGMDEEFIRSRLYKPFETTKGNAGMGVGVYESREFILALGGEIHVDSQPDVGTTFFIKLPLAENELIVDEGIIYT